MVKKIFLTSSVIAASFLLSGCSLPKIGGNSNNAANATFLKSVDSGATWQPKINIDAKKTISGIDVLSMAINPSDPNNIYIGTAANGLFMTKDAGETWAPVAFADKVYGLVFDPSNPNVMYGSGIFKNKGKIYKRMQEGQEWKEVYTEPADGSTISSLAIDRANPNVLYAGTSDGVIIKSVDGGQTWTNLRIDSPIKAPITNIAFDAANDAHVYFTAFLAGVLETRNAGARIEDITRQIDTIGNTTSVYTLTADPYLGGVAYIGTENGIFRRAPDGVWQPMNLIASSKAFPIRSITVNPKNSREIIYSSAKAIYKSTDGGATWSTFQLDTSKEISILKYDPTDATKLYAGMRSF